MTELLIINFPISSKDSFPQYSQIFLSLNLDSYKHSVQKVSPHFKILGVFLEFNSLLYSSKHKDKGF